MNLSAQHILKGDRLESIPGFSEILNAVPTLHVDVRGYFKGVVCNSILFSFFEDSKECETLA